MNETTIEIRPNPTLSLFGYRLKKPPKKFIIASSEPDLTLFSSEIHTPNSFSETSEHSQISKKHSRKNSLVSKYENDEKLKLEPVNCCRHPTESHYWCEECKRCIKTSLGMNNHLKSHSMWKQLECEICRQRFSSIGAFRQHEVVHSSVKPFVCPVCNRGFNWKQVLTEHLNTHTNRRTFSCGICRQEEFEEKDSILTHYEKNHGSSEHFKTFHICPLCTKEFNNKTKLSRHRHEHIKGTPHVCKTCNRAFKSMFLLNRHQDVHTKDKPHACSLCEKTFARQTHLKQHRLTHTGEKPYFCSICNKCFRDKRHYKVHGAKKDVMKKKINE